MPTKKKTNNRSRGQIVREFLIYVNNTLFISEQFYQKHHCHRKVFLIFVQFIEVVLLWTLLGILMLLRIYKIIVECNIIYAIISSPFLLQLPVNMIVCVRDVNMGECQKLFCVFFLMSFFLVCLILKRLCIPPVRQFLRYYKY